MGVSEEIDENRGSNVVVVVTVKRARETSRMMDKFRVRVQLAIRASFSTILL